jgi:hypothetical protein
MQLPRYAGTILCALIASFGTSASASAEETEIAFMPRTMTVTLLNPGGKYVAVDLKHIPEGGTCRMDEGAVIVRVEGGAAGMTRVRYAAPQTASGGCPFMTTFDLSNEDYAKARADFAAKEADAKARIEQMKKSLGDAWNDLVGNKN